MKFKYMDPQMIMTVVISLIILGIGVFAFFTVTQQTESSLQASRGYTTPSATTSNANNQSYYATKNLTSNTTTTGNSVFNIVGIVLIIGAIMTIVGLVYAYVKR